MGIVPPDPRWIEDAMRKEVMKMDITLYGKMTESLRAKQEWGTIVVMFGEGTEFEAICSISCNEDDGMWNGVLVFKSLKYSPDEGEDAGFPHGALQFQYVLPSAANGVLAETRAENYWNTLRSIFTDL